MIFTTAKIRQFYHTPKCFPILTFFESKIIISILFLCNKTYIYVHPEIVDIAEVFKGIVETVAV